MSNATVRFSELVPLTRALKTMFPAGTTGRPVSPSTAWRWVNKGVKARNGQRIKLTVKYMGHSPMVSEAMVQDFFDRQAEANRVLGLTKPEPSEVTERRLKAAGLK